MNEVQKIILTCLLGPEDPTAFARFQKREAEKVRRGKDPEKVRLASNTWKREHPEETRQGSRAWKSKNKERCRSYKTGEKREGHLAVRRGTNKLRYATDPRYRLECCLRSRLTTALMRIGGVKKIAPTMELTGCPVVELEAYLESLFKPGMTWENYGPVWHVDHIKPCAAFDLTNPEQQRLCFHWTNLQPLFALENLQKSDKYVV